MSQANPILVRANSRTGSTLMCSMLDAHSEIAMSYELFPSLLEGFPVGQEGHIGKKLKQALTERGARKICPDANIETFMLRCKRSGVEFRKFGEILKLFAEEGGSLEISEGRLKFCEMIARVKLEKSRKSIWGMKSSGDLPDKFAYWPEAKTLFMMRDGRDVFSSMKNNGNFNTDVERAATSWCKSFRNYQNVCKKSGRTPYVVVYEQLVRNPDETCKTLCQHLEIDFDERMIHHNEQDLTLFSANHLSLERVKKPVDDSAIGRYKSDMTAVELEKYMAIAGEDLAACGYET